MDKPAAKTDMGSKIAYGVLIVSVILSGIIILNGNKTQKKTITNTPSSTLTPTKTVSTDFDTEKDDEDTTDKVASVSAAPTTKIPSVTSGVSSKVITPTRSFTPTPTLIPTLTPSPTPTLIPTITPTVGPTATPTNKPTPRNTSTPTPTTVLLSSVSLSANDVYLYPGEQQQLTIYFNPSNVADKSLSWTYNGNIVDITASGLITAKSEGKTNVIVSGSNKKSTLLKITVSSAAPTTTKAPTSTPKPTATPTSKSSSTTTYVSPTSTSTNVISGSGLATGISVSTSSITLMEGETQKLTYSVVPSNATNPVIYRNYDGYVINLDENGLMTAKNAGTTTITLRTSNNVTKTISVTIKPKPTSTPTPTATPTPDGDGLVIDPGRGQVACDRSSKTFATNQCSEENASVRMTGHCTDRSVCQYGCGLVSVSIILQSHDPKYTPRCLLSTNMGCRTAFTGAGSCPVSWTTMSNTLKMNLGNSALYNSGNKFRCTKSSVADMICKGYVVIVNFQYTGGSGHWLVATSVIKTPSGDFDVAFKNPSYSDTKFDYWSDFVSSHSVKSSNYCMAVLASKI